MHHGAFFLHCKVELVCSIERTLFCQCGTIISFLWFLWCSSGFMSWSSSLSQGWYLPQHVLHGPVPSVWMSPCHLSSAVSWEDDLWKGRSLLMIHAEGRTAMMTWSVNDLNEVHEMCCCIYSKILISNELFFWDMSILNSINKPDKQNTLFVKIFRHAVDPGDIAVMLECKLKPTIFL